MPIPGSNCQQKLYTFSFPFHPSTLLQPIHVKTAILSKRFEPQPDSTFLALTKITIPGLLCLLLLVHSANAQTNRAFDGRPWNVSSGNLSVSFIQASPIGAFPRTNVLEPPPSLESQTHLKNLGLVANEDYIAWGAIEREPGEWQWQQHDAMEKLLH